MECLGEENRPLFFVYFPRPFIFSFLGGNGSNGGMIGLDPKPNSVPGMLAAPRASHSASLTFRFPSAKGVNISKMSSELEPRQGKMEMVPT